LSDEENFKLFDICSNKSGHGHNYRLEVCVEGRLDSKRSMLRDIEDMDSYVQKFIDEKVNYKRLDIEVPYFIDNQSTCENILEFLWFGFRDGLKLNLLGLKLWENNNNYFEFFDTKMEKILR